MITDPGTVKAARKTGGKAAAKAAKSELKRQREENEKIEIARTVMQELSKYETEYGKAALENAREIAAAGINGYLDSFRRTKAQAKAMPRSTAAEKEQRRDALMQISNIRAARKAAKRYFPDGVVEFDSSVFETLFKAEDEADLLLHETIKELKAAREKGDRTAARELKAKVKAIQKQQAKTKLEIKIAMQKNSVYSRAVKPYLDARKTIAQSENYRHLDTIEALYAPAKIRLHRRRQNKPPQRNKA